VREASNLGRGWRAKAWWAVLRSALSRCATSEWKAYAIEINLRKGGTAHPF
jgi:hypothetical protein